MVIGTFIKYFYNVYCSDIMCLQHKMCVPLYNVSIYTKWCIIKNILLNVHAPIAPYDILKN